MINNAPLNKNLQFKVKNMQFKSKILAKKVNINAGELSAIIN